MTVQVEREEIEPCRVALNVTVGPEPLQAEIDAVFNQLARRTAVPGFRPGKAPRSLVKRYIDEERVRKMAIDRVLADAYAEAIRQAGVRPYREASARLEVQEEEIEPGKGFQFRATVPLAPHVHLGDLEGLTGRRVVTVIRDADVDAEIERRRDLLAEYRPTDEPVESGYRVRARLEVTADSERVEEASHTEPALIEVGSNVADFDAGLVGLRAGEQRTFTFTCPEDFAQETLRGKELTAHVEAIEVQKLVRPTEEELARLMGAESVEEMRERIRSSLQEQADAVSSTELRESLLREVARRSEVHYPSEMLDAQVKQRFGALLSALERRKMSLPEYLSVRKKDLSELEAEIAERVREELEQTLVVVAVAQQHGITVDEEEVERELREMAERGGAKLQALRTQLAETGELDTIRSQILFRKVTDFLIERAEIRDVEA